MQNILLGTRNPGKLREYYDLLEEMDSSLKIRLLDPVEAGMEFGVEEVGESYLENATLKALTYSQTSGLLTLADDSGLEVDALGGRPGIFSARFAPQPAATDADRRRHLLDLLKEHRPPWSARFRCVVVIASGDEILFTSEGECRGEITAAERGEYGFGYDPIFLVEGYGRTMAELDTAVKNQISHRARAVAPARDFLLRYLPGSGL
ncbi:MAG TPA: RdgB/HAM1 family non-canonical purine NTP pyrophosphatase [Anaerolineales bacterium]|nr:RdgB/HAM1 family non-canonical purine NTP pyrophosphatase [Anaerolineales bacterium]